MRDANDEVAAALFSIASKETINRSLKKEMLNLSENLAIIGDHRDDSTQFLDANVVIPLSQYGTHCRNAKAEVKNIYGAKEKETSKRRQLGKIKEKFPTNTRQIMKAETDLAKACTQVSHMQRALEEHIEIFEKKKLTNLKCYLMDFIKAEISFHSEAIQIFTKAYTDFMKLDVESDFKDFKVILKQNPANVRFTTVSRATPDRIIGNPNISESLASFLRISPKFSHTSLDYPRQSFNHDTSGRTSAVGSTKDIFSYDESSEDPNSENAEDSIDEIEDLEKDLDQPEHLESNKMLEAKSR